MSCRINLILFLSSCIYTCLQCERTGNIDSLSLFLPYLHICSVCAPQILIQLLNPNNFCREINSKKINSDIPSTRHMKTLFLFFSHQIFEIRNCPGSNLFSSDRANTYHPSNQDEPKALRQS